MAGLIDVGILKPELAGAFGSGYRASEQNRMQSQQDAQALEMNRMKLEQLKQDKIALTQLQEQLRAAGKESDPNKIFDVMIGSGNPDLVAKGMEGKQRYKQLLAADELLRQYSPELYPQATTNPLGAGRAPTAAPAAPAVGMEPNALGSGVFGMNALAAGRAPEAEPAPTNQLAAPQEPDRIAALRADIVRLRSVNDPRTKALADVKQAQLNELLKVQSVSPGQSLVQGGRVVYTAPDKIRPESQPEIIRLQKAVAELPVGSPERKQLEGRIDRLIKGTEGTRVEVKLPEQEKAFEGELGKGQAKKVIEDKAAAEDAKSIITTVQEGRRLLQSGVITGFGADFLTSVGAALNQAGINFAEDAVANTQAFTANMAANVGRIIKQFGAGTGLSNADREYAEKMAGGKVTLDRKAIERILDINERMARNVIALHNKNVSGIKTNVPLSVEVPVGRGSAGQEPSSVRSQADAIIRGGR